MPRPPKKFHPHPFAYHQEIELLIDSLTNLGDGVGRVDGWVVFVPFTLPGERVRARVHRNDKNCSRADLLEILEPSPDRVAPACPLFGQCGGCQYQHLSYHRQLEWKSRQVEGLLRHMAGIEFAVEPCLPSPRQWHYRSKITPHFDHPRDGQIGPIGFLPNGRRFGVIDVPQCPIAMEEINAALPAARDEIRRRSHRRGGTLLLRATDGRVESNHSAVVTETIGRLRFDFLAGDFFQNNPFILPAFTAHVADEASRDGTRFLVDAYCGSGLFALSLADRFEQVAGVEIAETSADRARHNARLNGITNASFLTASAEAIFADIPFPAAHTAVVIDPPRKGCSPEFLAQLAAFGPARVVYVSCDPATQIRDLATLRTAGFTLQKVQPFDLFPHTRHLECVMSFHRHSTPA